MIRLSAWVTVERAGFDCVPCKKRWCDLDGEIWAETVLGGRIRSRGYAPADAFGWRYKSEAGKRGKHVWLRVCPLPKIPVWWGRVLEEHGRYTRGLLLRPGGTEDQPRAYLRGMELVGKCLDEFQAIKADNTIPKPKARIRKASGSRTARRR